MNTSSPTKKQRYTGSENLKSPSTVDNEKIIQQEQKLIKNQQRLAQIQQKVNKLKQDRAAKICQLDSIQLEIKQCKQHKQMLPLIQQLREHYKKLKQQLGSKFYYEEDDVDVDQMSYEQLLQLGQKIGKVSKGLSEEQFLKLERVFCTSVEQCSICQDNLIVGSQCIKLKCGHLYDTDCLKQWFKMEKVCPNCKSQSI